MTESIANIERTLVHAVVKSFECTVGYAIGLPAVVTFVIAVRKAVKYAFRSSVSVPVSLQNCGLVHRDRKYSKCRAHIGHAVAKSSEYTAVDTVG